MTLAIGLALVALLAGTAEAAPEVTLWTDLGGIRIELLDSVAPVHVRNFLQRAESGAYTGTRFHRVIPGYFIQGGSAGSRGGSRRPAWAADPGEPIEAEPGGPAIGRGLVAMARDVRGDGASDRAQFFIVLGPAPLLDELGFTVFGRVVDGIEVADRIAAAPRDPSHHDRPLRPVAIREVRVSGSATEADAVGAAGATALVAASSPDEPHTASTSAPAAAGDDRAAGERTPAGGAAATPLGGGPTAAPVAEASGADQRSRRLIVAVPRANVRSGPGTDRRIVARLGRDTELVSDARRGRWYRVRLPGGRQGWVRDDTVTIEDPPDDHLSP